MAFFTTIHNLDTIKYRTDCVAETSQSTYHIRSTDMRYATSANPFGYVYKGYEKINDVSPATLPDTSVVNVDLGHNPNHYESTRDLYIAENSVICDKLIMFGDFVQNDFYYDKLIFEKPMLTSAYYHYTYDGKYHAPTGNDSESFLLINEVYLHGTGGVNLGVYLKGQEIKNGGESSSYDRMTRSLVGVTRNTDKVNLSIGYYFCKSLTSYMGLSGLIHRQRELFDMFTFAGDATNSPFIHVLESFDYGGIVLHGSSHIDCQVRRNNQINTHNQLHNVISEFTPNYLWIIPFVSEAEYNAALAVAYKWDDYAVDILKNNG